MKLRYRSVMAGTVLALAAGRAPLLAAQRVAVDVPKAADYHADVMGRLVTVDVDQVTLSQALEVLATRADIRITFRAQLVNSIATPVTLHVKNVALGVVLDRVLRGTGLRTEVPAADAVSITSANSDEVRPVPAGGTIDGKVVDAKTKQPLHGAKVTLDAATKGVSTDDAGRFRFSGVVAGEHVVRVRLLGYVKVAKPVTMTDDATVSVDVALAQSMNQLDQIVVTGTVIPTELKAVPNAITIITAKEIEQRGITNITQFFRGDVPGLYAQNTGMGVYASAGKTAVASRGSTSFDGVFNSGIKTFVDGVELADPTLLGLIDPKSIARIEILTGPQASTIYGSNAINGVMQIFTKRGTSSRPLVTVLLQAGGIQNQFSRAFAAQHDDNIQVSGVEGSMSYNIGGSYGHVGSFTPGVKSATLSGFGGAHLQRGAFSGDVNVRHIGISNINHDAGGIRSEQAALGIYAVNNIVAPSQAVLARTGNSIGLTMNLSPVLWWTNTMTLGADHEWNGETDTRRYSNPADSSLTMIDRNHSHASIGLNTTVHVPVTSIAQAVLTVGGEGWNDLDVNVSGGDLQVLNSTSGDYQEKVDLFRQVTHNRGVFVQGQLGIWDALFLTYGLRADWNPTYGKDKLPTTEPRFGVALTHDVGPVTAKVRASVGHSTRPPAIGQIRAISAGAYFAPYYPLPFDIQIGNRDLLPEQQQGWEGGIDVFLGSKISLTVTRYNQTVDDLIQLSQYADSVRGLHPISYYGLNPADFPQYPDGYAYQDQREWLNLGSIRNQGWTMQGTATLRAFTTQLTFSNTKSRIIGITPKFRREFSYYVVGSSFDGLAEHTWGVVETYARGGTMMSLAVNGVGQIGGGDKFQKEIGGYGTIRLSVNNRVRMSVPQLYHGLYHPYATAYLNVHQRLSSHVDGIVQLNNLLNAFRNDIDAFSANIGRQTSLGLQIRL